MVMPLTYLLVLQAILNKVQWERNIFSVPLWVMDKQLWCSKSLKSHESESKLCHLTYRKLCSKWVPVFDKPKETDGLSLSYTVPDTVGL